MEILGPENQFKYIWTAETCSYLAKYWLFKNDFASQWQGILKRVYRIMIKSEFSTAYLVVSFQCFNAY